jgi:tetrapyrrole methylase family protein/MazG family protein
LVLDIKNKENGKSAPLQTPLSSPPVGPSLDLDGSIFRLKILLDGLLDEEKGCPWDKEQTPGTLTEDFLEEVYELREALLLEKTEDIKEEAGDLLFLLAFLARKTEKSYGFGLSEMIDGVVDKMVLRHPHVFGENQEVNSVDDVLTQWFAIKRKVKPKSGVLSTVPTALPALSRCHRLSSKASKAGFDWPGFLGVREKITEELGELDVEIKKGNFKEPINKARLMHEVGDLLASVVNLARHLGFSAEKALTEYNNRFINRFEYIEQKLSQKGQKPEDVKLADLEILWQEAKER